MNKTTPTIKKCPNCRKKITINDKGELHCKCGWINSKEKKACFVKFEKY